MKYLLFLFAVQAAMAQTGTGSVARITEIHVAGAPIPVPKLGVTNVGPLKFATQRNSIQIDYAAIDYRLLEQLRYQFRLEGAGTDWSELVPSGTVQFANLAPGRYRFLVKAVSADAPGGSAPATFAFTITPFWQRWWFLAVVAIAAAFIAYQWHCSRMSRQLAAERVRRRIATDLHDDIGASVSRIAIMSEALKQKSIAPESRSQRMLSEIAETSRNVVEKASDIVWSIDPRRDTLGDAATRLRAFGRRTRISGDPLDFRSTGRPAR